MPKYYKKKYYKGSRDKYSVEQIAGALEIPAASQAYSTVVGDTGVQGMRKVKHLTVSVSSSSGTVGGVAYWALVYKPQGVALNQMNITGTSTMYEPNQYVMGCGVFDFNGGPLRIRCPLSRNLNSGDSVCLIMANPSSSTPLIVRYVVQYAITLQ